MEYWCHMCRSTVQVSEHLDCVTCCNPFTEAVEQEEDHPRDFVPYQPSPPIGQVLTELLLSPSVRSIRYYPGIPEAETSIDNVIAQIMQNDPNTYGPPPASENSIENLPQCLVDQETIRNFGTAWTAIDEFGSRLEEDRQMLECSICKEELIQGTQAVQMPCQHFYHDECIKQWLKMHNSCPVCRCELKDE